jgi:hypothetical protein
VTSMMVCTATVPYLLTQNQFDSLPDDEDNDCLSDKDMENVMETVEFEALAIKPARLLSFRTVNAESDLSLNGDSILITPSTLTVIKPSLTVPLSKPNVCTNDVDKVISLDKVSPAEKSI